ncbi:hypothetical protein J2S55_007958 [Streptosporangium brasiliense]|uniref:Transposase n=1 Tax=Streptosporangium brasiliense TaxID=47480 RepID=A0ABT9RHD5_9ACTN|nr:hypothetical protein [Streptosporangium brasiliense]
MRRALGDSLRCLGGSSVHGRGVTVGAALFRFWLAVLAAAPCSGSGPGSCAIFTTSGPAARACVDIRAWMDQWNEAPKPFAWTKTAEEILESLAQYCRRISGG